MDSLLEKLSSLSDGELFLYSTIFLYCSVLTSAILFKIFKIINENIFDN